MSIQKIKHTVRLTPATSLAMADYARSRRASQSTIIEAALASLLSPDGSERIEAALGRRLDRLTRQLDRLAWNVELTNETLALYIRFWLTTTASQPDTAMPVAQAKGAERWENFVQSLTRRMERSQRLGEIIAREMEAREPSPAGGSITLPGGD
jgi:hypothetical protein